MGSGWWESHSTRVDNMLGPLPPSPNHPHHLSSVGLRSQAGACILLEAWSV